MVNEQIQKIIRKFRNKTFLKYCGIGALLFAFTTISTFVGREIFGINTAIITPIIFFAGFLIKYALYDLTGMLRRKE